MNKRQKFIVYSIIGALVFSVVGTGLLIFFDNDSSSNHANQLDDQAQQIADQEADRLAAANCEPLDPNPLAVALAAPETPTFDQKATELGIEDLVVGTGAEVAAGDCIVAHYHGSLAATGDVFDSSFLRGDPARFSLLGVVQGWQQGIPGMKEGGTRRLVIPSDMGYGPSGRPPSIGPDQDLVFTVELVRIEK